MDYKKPKVLIGTVSYRLPFNRNYQEVECPKCGYGWKDTDGDNIWSVLYNDPTDRLIVRCRRCTFGYDMDPRVKKD